MLVQQELSQGWSPQPAVKSAVSKMGKWLMCCWACMQNNCSASGCNMEPKIRTQCARPTWPAGCSAAAVAISNGSATAGLGEAAGACALGDAAAAGACALGETCTDETAELRNAPACKESLRMLHAVCCLQCREAIGEQKRRQHAAVLKLCPYGTYASIRLHFSATWPVVWPSASAGVEVLGFSGGVDGSVDAASRSSSLAVCRNAHWHEMPSASSGLHTADCQTAVKRRASLRQQSRRALQQLLVKVSPRPPVPGWQPRCPSCPRC